MNSAVYSFSLVPDFGSAELIRKELVATLERTYGSAGTAASGDLCQIVSELINNVVEHGNSSSLTAELKLGKDKVSFTLTTDGVLFDPTQTKAVMPEFDEHDNLPDGGFGLAIIHNLADEFLYRQVDGKNVTTISKYFKSETTGGNHGDQC